MRRGCIVTSVPIEIISVSHQRKMSDYQPNGSFIMPRLEYFTCAQCEQMVYDNAHSLRWYDVDLCSLKCFRMYFERQFRVCATCQTVASTDGDICIYHSAHGLFTFCDANCMDTYRYLNDPCSFCFAQCSKNGRTTARSVGKKKYCSLQCIKANGRIIGTKFNGGQCYTCGKKRSTKYEIKAERANLRNMCSDDCLKLFELNAKVALDTCSVCHIKFDGASSDAAELVEFSGEKRIFCSNICLSYHLKNDTRNNACLECGELVRYYEMIRTLATDEAEKMWCSLDCAKRYASARTPPRLSNTHIELVNRELRGNFIFGHAASSIFYEISIRFRLFLYFGRSRLGRRSNGIGCRQRNLQQRPRYRVHQG